MHSTTFSKFWKDNEMMLPLMAKLVRNICYAPGTSIPSKQEFSMGKNMITQNRNKLSDKRV